MSGRSLLAVERSRLRQPVLSPRHIRQRIRYRRRASAISVTSSAAMCSARAEQTHFRATICVGLGIADKINAGAFERVRIAVVLFASIECAPSPRF